MSGYEIPFHIQEEIMKRLPVKSLIQFRCVSKAWKSLIDSPQFIYSHSLRRHTQPQHLLVSCNTPQDGINYLSFIDDETLFQQQRPVSNSPPCAKENRLTCIVGISHGLVCFYSLDAKLVVLWNPSIRKSIVISLPKIPYPYVVGQRLVGFGVCPLTTDPKIVTIKQFWDESNIETSYRCQVMVYTLSSGEWRSLPTNLPTKPFQGWWEVVADDGFIYWRGLNMVMSFDVTNESFEMIDLPTSLAGHYFRGMGTYKLRETLAILQYDGNTCTVWMMEDGLPRSFAKLSVIEQVTPNNTVMGFTKSGAPILKMENDGETKLVVYESNSEHNIFEISKDSVFFTIIPYMETLLLLGRSDCSSF